MGEEEQQSQQQQTPTAASPIYQESQEKSAKWLWLLIIIIIVGALVFAFVKKIGPFSQINFGSGSQTEESPVPEELISPSPKVSPEAELDKSEPAIRVLNGTGIEGTASSLKDFLEEKGWRVEEIGNADSYDFERTVLRFKEDTMDFEEILFSDLSDDYSVEIDSSELEATDSADIEVILGAK